jgi:hypothetical protein
VDRDFLRSWKASVAPPALEFKAGKFLARLALDSIEWQNGNPKSTVRSDRATSGVGDFRAGRFVADWLAGIE